MTGWLAFWTLVLVLALCSYAVLVVRIGLTGWRELRQMLRARRPR